MAAPEPGPSAAAKPAAKMRRFRCKECLDRGIESEWEHHHKTSFCQTCGSEGTVIVEYACFKCSEDGMRFWAPEDDDAYCPECESKSPRIVYAPMIETSKHEGFKFADKMLKTEMDRRGLTDTGRPNPGAAPTNPFAARWGNPAEVLARAAGTKGSGDLIHAVPKRLPTSISGKDDRKTL